MKASSRWSGHAAGLALVGALVLASAEGSGARAQRQQTEPPPSPQAPSSSTAPSPETPKPAPAAPKTEHPMTPAQARELFRSVDTILKFDSEDTGLPIRHTVKRRLTTRKAVEAFLIQKMHEDKDTARVERSAIVLKKFGLLDRDFDLRPFLLSLLKEQIAGYYDAKTKTVNLLNWINPEEQKPVLAHELTHALQDQHVDLDTWGDQTLDGTPKDVADDNRHLRKDESDTAREAALEGQAMVAYMDWSLAPTAQSLRTSPDVPVDQDDDKADPDSPVLSRAPLVLKESLLFPYRDGLRFEQTLLKDHGAQAAFASVLDRPPDSSYEIMHPRAYEQHARPALLSLPDLHPLLDADYVPYDLGVMGALDVRMLGQAFGGAAPAADFAATWDGGVYYAAQRRSATAPEKETPASIGLLYLSGWTTPEAAASFARQYAASLGHKYRQLKPEATPAAKPGGSLNELVTERFSTEEGPVIIARDGRKVFISEGFAAPLAASLEQQILDIPVSRPSSQEAQLASAGSSHAAAGMSPVDPSPESSAELSAPLVRLFTGHGMMKAGLRQVKRPATD